jgi:hypothetical protein
VIGDARPADERERITGGRKYLVIRVQPPVEAEGLPVDAKADIPAAAESGVAAQMEFLVLRVAAAEEMRVLPRIIQNDVARQRLDLRSTLAEPGSSMIQRCVHDPGARYEPARRAEILADAGHHVSQSEAFSIARENSFPQRRVARQPVCLVEASCRLKRSAVHLSEHDSSVDIADTIVIAPNDAIRLRHADA